MPVRLSAAWRAAPLVLLLPLLAGCTLGRDEFPPACPAASVLPPTGDVALYRSTSGAHDLTDVVLQGRVAGISGRCRPGDRKNTLDVAVTVGFDFVRGPAMQGDRIDVPAFVAVTEGERILDKKVYRVPAAFPRNVDRIHFTSAAVDMSLPVSANKTGAAYTILAGFQLTPQQLAASRGRAR
jgi:hypothetical protein